MSERYFYRASPELAADLRQYKQVMDTFIEEVVKPFVADFPDNEPVQNAWSQQVIGFRDGKSDQDPPEGLSRSQKRDYLIPKRGYAGDAWQARLIALNDRPTLETVFDKHDVPRAEWRTSPGKVFHADEVFLADWVDFGGDDMLIYLGCELESVPPALTPIKRSEGYAIQERYKESHEQ